MDLDLGKPVGEFLFESLKDIVNGECYPLAQTGESLVYPAIVFQQLDSRYDRVVDGVICRERIVQIDIRAEEYFVLHGLEKGVVKAIMSRLSNIEKVQDMFSSEHLIYRRVVIAGIKCYD